MNKKNRQHVDQWLDEMARQEKNGPVVVDFRKGGVIGMRDMSMVQNKEWHTINQQAALVST